MRSREFTLGLRAVAPILLGVLPFGMIYGALAIGAGLTPLMAQAMSLIVFAGSAQFITTQLIVAGAPGLVIVATGAIVNARHALYSASLAPALRELNRAWKWLIAYLLTDEMYATIVQRYSQTLLGEAGRYRHWFALGAGAGLFATWQISTAIGVFVGAQIPPSWNLDFALPLTFIAIVVPALKDRASLVAALVGGVAAVVFFAALLKLGLFAAALLGIGAGLLAARFSARE